MTPERRACFGVVVVWLVACGGAQQATPAQRAVPLPSSAGMDMATSGTGSTEPEPEDQPPFVDLANAGRPWRGAARPLVTIVEVADFECPFSARVQATVDQVLEQYGDQVRVVFRGTPLPMHANAPRAHQAAWSIYHQAGNDAFWAYHDLLFSNQRSLNEAGLVRLATRIGGIDMDRFRSELATGSHAPLVTEDEAWAARYQLGGTPHFLIGGQSIAGSHPFSAFRHVIDRELAIAEELMRSGTAQDTLTTVRLGAHAQERRPPPPRPDPDAIYYVPVEEGAVRGPEDALVTIVEFADFECPFSARVQSTLDAIQQRYGDAVRIVFRHNPLQFHANARRAALAALDAKRQRGDRGFWQMHDLLFENQRDLSEPDLLRYARRIGLNMARFRRALRSEEGADTIAVDQALTTSLGSRGTPAFFINGRNVRGAQRLENFVRVIDQELARARDLVAEGTAPSDVYDAAIANGSREPVVIE